MAAQSISVPLNSLNNSRGLGKVHSVVLFLAAVYVLLSLNPELLIHWKVISMVVLGIVLIVAQPQIRSDESQVYFKSGKIYNVLIHNVSGFGLIGSIVEWAYFKNISATALLQFGAEALVNGSIPLFTITGSFFFLTGALLRIYAIYSLNKYFSSQTVIQRNYRIMSDGPYRAMRHPIYTGSYFVMIGCALFLHSISGLLILGVGMFIVYNLKINTEENLLIEKFGICYKLFALTRDRFIPGMW